MRFGLRKPQDIGEISMKTKILKVKITFLEPVLGTWPSNQNVARDFIASKSGCSHDRGRGGRSGRGCRCR
jgi:hypothetical protein